MAKQQRTAISPTRAEDYPEWYQQVVKAADLAENSPVRGCMVIKPWGYAIWERIQQDLDRKFKDTGHVNAYFPLFIPKSYLEKEAEHVEGFAKECAVVTHTKLELGEDGKLHPASPLEEPLIVRPTSETVIGEMYAKWVQSYRDLPVLINQWANVVRWEMRTRLFLRTTEFLWQEGHTAHATEEEAWEETRKMLDVYEDFAVNHMAMPVLKGEKTADERFPGAVSTLCIEAMMQDRKALQAGTSHFLGQNFAKASGIQFLSAAGNQEFAWTTSWGVSTRLVGGLIMTHSDDDGLVLPPRLAPIHVVILPVTPKEETCAAVLNACEALSRELKQIIWCGRPVEVHVDKRDLRGGDKMWQWVKKGVPLRVEIGPRDLEKEAVFMARRDTGEKKPMPRADFIEQLPALLDTIQANLLQRALDFRQENSRNIDTLEEFKAFFASENHGGFAWAHWNDEATSVAEPILSQLKVTIRCVPFLDSPEEGTCLFSGKPSKQRVVFAKSY